MIENVKYHNNNLLFEIKISYVVVILFGTLALGACKNNEIKLTESPQIKEQWTDSVYATMNLEEKVGQLFMAATYSNREPAHTDSIQKLIEKYHIGGVIFFQGGPVRQVNMTNRFQKASKIPILVGIDAEWGVNMRLDSTSGFPYNMTLGAVQNNDLIRRIGVQIGKHCNLLGIHNNYAPVVDINTNPNNPVIGTRSFGEDRDNVTAKAMAFMNGMQSQGVLACAKHFPGHGDTSSDSHKSLPIINFSAQRIDSIELHPYKAMIAAELGSIMVAHLEVPSLEEKPGLPSSLSYRVVNDLLKDSLKFNGLIMTDALNMKGVSNFSDSGSVDLTAFLAGHDVLLFSENVPKGIATILNAFKQGRFTEDRLGYSVKKILKAKFDLGLHQFKPLPTKDLVAQLNSEENVHLNKELAEHAVTILKNDKDLLPLKAGKNIAVFTLGNGNSERFIQQLESKFSVTRLASMSDPAMAEADVVVIGYHRLNYRRSYRLTAQEIAVIEEIAKKKQVVLNVFASQYVLEKLKFDNIESVLVSYENSRYFQEAGAAIILGDLPSRGKLPARFNSIFDTGFGLELKTQ